MQFFTYAMLLTPALAAPFERNGLDRRSAKENAAAYFLDNNPDGSSIVSLRIGGDGTLSDPVRTSTNGFGLIGTNTTFFPNAADSLFSQDSVVVSGDLLFTVNSGSNTVVMFRIDAANPWSPKMVGQPADTLGEFPVSVTYSQKLKTACVLNGGARAGVSCFRADPLHGLQAVGPLRSLEPTFSQITPANGPPNTASEIIFNPDSSAVFALVKGNAGTTPVTPGYIIGWPVQHGTVSTKSIVNKIADISMEFGAVFLSQDRLFVADPSYGASIVSISSGLKVTEEVHTVVPGQIAICWAAEDPSLGNAYGIDAGQNMIYTFDAGTGALKGSISVTTIGNATTNGGLFDSAVNNNRMYSLAKTPGIVVTDLVQGQQQQYLDLTSLGSRQGWMGMALYA